MDPNYVISYPRSGKTWLVNMLNTLICEKHDIPYSFDAAFSLFGNPLGIFAIPTHLARDETYSHIDFYRSLEPTFPTFDHDNIQHASSWKEVPADNSAYVNSKVLFLSRDPKEIIISNYFYYSKYREDYPFTASSLFHYLCGENGGMRTLLKFYETWSNNQDVPDSFTHLKYLDLKNNCPTSLRKVLDFFNFTDYTDELINKAISACSLENMKAYEKQSRRLYSKNTEDSNACFVREGKSGQSSKYLSDEDNQYIESIMGEIPNSFYEE